MAAGVILESEDLHRRAYNATFDHFNVQCGESCHVSQHEQGVLGFAAAHGLPKATEVCGGRRGSLQQAQQQQSNLAA